MATSNFPLLSFQEFLTGSEVEKRAVAQKLYNAFHTYGWVYLKDFGITKAEIAEMFAMVSRVSHLTLSLKLTLYDSLRSISSDLWMRN